MRLAQLSPWHVRCGIAIYTEGLSRGLAEHGAEVYVVRLHRWGRKDETYYRWYVSRVPKEVALIHCQFEYSLYGAKAPDPEGCATAFYEGLKRHGKPIVTTMHSTGMFEVDRIVERMSGRVIVHNEYMKRLFGGECTVIPMGCTPSEPLPMEKAKEQLGLKGKVVGYVGFVAPYKGLETLIEAVHGIPEVTLLIGGGYHIGRETDYIMGLKQLSLKLLPNRCRWLGYVPEEELPTVYGSMDIVAYPSIFMSESGALLMALSYGKAVVCSNLPPVLEKEKLGILVTFKSRDTEDLKYKIDLLLSDSDQKKCLEDKARMYSGAVTWNHIAKVHLKLYREVLESKV